MSCVFLKIDSTKEDNNKNTHSFPIGLLDVTLKSITDILSIQCRKGNEIYSVYKQYIYIYLFLRETRYPCQCTKHISPMDPFKWILQQTLVEPCKCKLCTHTLLKVHEVSK